MSELQKAVSDAERKAHELITTERAKMERALAEAKRQASEDALTVVNQQEDSSEVGPPATPSPLPCLQVHCGLRVRFGVGQTWLEPHLVAITGGHSGHTGLPPTRPGEVLCGPPHHADTETGSQGRGWPRPWHVWGHYLTPGHWRQAQALLCGSRSFEETVGTRGYASRKPRRVLCSWTSCAGHHLQPTYSLP